MTEDEFLALKGLGSAASGIGIDRYGPNMYRLTNNQIRKTFQEINSQNDTYYANRAKAKEEYKSLVEQGKIVPKTTVERIITSAHGHPDLKATQAARRMAKKKGIDWKTGKKIK